MDGSQAYTFRKTGRTLIFGIHTGHNTVGNVRSLVANHVTELKNFNFWTYEEIVKLKYSQLEIREVEKKFN
jgi:hypothetical protein